MRLLIDFGSSFRINTGWFDLLLMYVGVLFGFIYGRNWFCCRLSWTSRKSTTCALVSIVIDKPWSLKSFIIYFFFRSVSGPDKLRNTPRPSSRYSPTSLLSGVIGFNSFSSKDPTSSQISAPSKHPIGTSKSSLPDFLPMALSREGGGFYVTALWC